MRTHLSAWLALPAFLSVLVVAVPSPAAYLQQPLPSPAAQQSTWRSISDRLIEAVWGTSKDGEDDYTRRKCSASARTLAPYGGDVVLRFNVSTAEEAQSLAEAADTLLLDVWDFTHNWADIRVSKAILPSLLTLLPTSLQHAHVPLIHERDLASAIENTFPGTNYPPKTATSHSPSSRQFSTLLPTSTGEDSWTFFHEYRPLSVIHPWMRLLSRLFSTHVQLITLGTSYEGREILGLQVGVPPADDQPETAGPRKTVLITGGLHAREWISTSTVTYIAYNLITSYGKVPSITDLLDEYDFVFVPTVNPDGYAYTWETDRLWRKNRQATTVRFCQGIDLDHGFGFEWDGLRTAGNPCSESYAGKAPFEAVESRQLAEWARRQKEEKNVEFVGFLDLHSYSQQILYPYSYSCDFPPPSQENLEELAVGMEKAIRRSSSYSYEPMAACEGNVALASRSRPRTLLPMLEQSGGSALDWFYHEMQVHFAYQIKLRDQGTYGFLLPSEHIIPTGREILDAVLFFGDFLREGYPKQDVEDVMEESAAPASTDDLELDDGEYTTGFGPRWDLRRRRK
ncbi:hypothetical protein BDY17DRAFT_299528 [Neohortaea acidophila]|uniref:Inactive metallocarboxypeptidase ECM14 n=1 Tax=Neohortaea acidophila TaxID=245834 RepID=A0A6A6PQK4_9PEZI|nr:uncharacterized protein BDY17DRAFT_299528 [Neohortaea acidophila]KAF2481723.1 hypothetical protein BDY17DRAFT_299528 [Neohortaea acidophila]